jgi:hypothetical protein
MSIVTATTMCPVVTVPKAWGRYRICTDALSADTPFSSKLSIANQ